MLTQRTPLARLGGPRSRQRKRVGPSDGLSARSAGLLITGRAKFSCACGRLRSARQAGDRQI